MGKKKKTKKKNQEQLIFGPDQSSLVFLFIPGIYQA